MLTKQTGLALAVETFVETTRTLVCVMRDLAIALLTTRALVCVMFALAVALLTTRDVACVTRAMVMA